jgi:hypothetical protein
MEGAPGLNDENLNVEDPWIRKKPAQIPEI